MKTSRSHDSSGRGSRTVVSSWLLVAGVLLSLWASPVPLRAQPAVIYRVGIIHHGGSYKAAVDGLRAGLKDLGWEEGKQYVVHARDGRGEMQGAEEAARMLEAEKVDIICAFATSSVLKAKEATKRVPIVFQVGTDPVKLGLIESLRRPGGRLTGVYTQVTDLTGKRLEVLKELVPRLRRVAVFYNPDNPSARESLKGAREAGARLKVGLVERPVHSSEELRAGLSALRPSEVDGYFHVSDAMMTSNADLIIETTRAKKLPLILQDREAVVRGALASYGLSYYRSGQLMARYVRDVLLGANPGELAVEQVSRLELVLNVKTAKSLGLAIPASVLAHADEVIDR